MNSQFLCLRQGTLICLILLIMPMQADENAVSTMPQRIHHMIMKRQTSSSSILTKHDEHDGHPEKHDNQTAQNNHNHTIQMTLTTITHTSLTNGNTTAATTATPANSTLSSECKSRTTSGVPKSVIQPTQSTSKSTAIPNIKANYTHSIATMGATLAYPYNHQANNQSQQHHHHHHHHHNHDHKPEQMNEHNDNNQHHQHHHHHHDHEQEKMHNHSNHHHHHHHHHGQQNDHHHRPENQSHNSMVPGSFRTIKNFIKTNTIRSTTVTLTDTTKMPTTITKSVSVKPIESTTQMPNITLRKNHSNPQKTHSTIQKIVGVSVSQTPVKTRPTVKTPSTLPNLTVTFQKNSTVNQSTSEAKKNVALSVEAKGSTLPLTPQTGKTSQTLVKKPSGMTSATNQSLNVRNPNSMVGNRSITTAKLPVSTAQVVLTKGHAANTTIPRNINQTTAVSPAALGYPKQKTMNSLSTKFIDQKLNVTIQQTEKTNTSRIPVQSISDLGKPVIGRKGSMSKHENALENKNTSVTATSASLARYSVSNQSISPTPKNGTFSLLNGTESSRGTSFSLNGDKVNRTESSGSIVVNNSYHSSLHPERSTFPGQLNIQKKGEGENATLRLHGGTVFINSTNISTNCSTPVVTQQQNYTLIKNYTLDKAEENVVLSSPKSNNSNITRFENNTNTTTTTTTTTAFNSTINTTLNSINTTNTNTTISGTNDTEITVTTTSETTVKMSSASKRRYSRRSRSRRTYSYDSTDDPYSSSTSDDDQQTYTSSTQTTRYNFFAGGGGYTNNYYTDSWTSSSTSYTFDDNWDSTTKGSDFDDTSTTSTTFNYDDDWDDSTLSSSNYGSRDTYDDNGEYETSTSASMDDYDDFTRSSYGYDKNKAAYDGDDNNFYGSSTTPSTYQSFTSDYDDGYDTSTQRAYDGYTPGYEAGYSSMTQSTKDPFDDDYDYDTNSKSTYSTYDSKNPQTKTNTWANDYDYTTASGTTQNSDSLNSSGDTTSNTSWVSTKSPFYKNTDYLANITIKKKKRWYGYTETIPYEFPTTPYTGPSTRRRETIVHETVTRFMPGGMKYKYSKVHWDDSHCDIFNPWSEPPDLSTLFDYYKFRRVYYSKSRTFWEDVKHYFVKFVRIFKKDFRKGKQDG